MKSVLFLVLILLIGFACTPSPEQRQLDVALKKAGKNRGEMEKTLAHYAGDSLKQEAAAFLIRHMIYHATATRQGMRPDIACLTAPFLIRTIDLAFEAWGKPWSRKIPFDDFCRYILPYRAVNEPPCSLRKEIMDEYMPLLDSLHAQTPLEAGTILQAVLQKRLRFKEEESTDFPSVEEVYRSGKGRCDDLAITAAFIMRAVGIPVSIEYTVWSKRDGEHYWCALLNDDRKFYAFAPENEPPGKLAAMLTRKFVTPAKIYRYEYAPVAPLRPAADAYRTFLKSPLLRDVTREYDPPVTDIRIRCDKNRKRAEALVYLCAFNQAHWRPFATGKRENDSCLFHDVVGDDLFIVAEASEENPHFLEYITSPFYLDREGRIHKFTGRSGENESISLPRGEKKYADLWNTLAVWDDSRQQFRALRLAVDSTEARWILKDAPGDALFKANIRQVSLDGEIRPFFIQNDSIRIY